MITLVLSFILAAVLALYMLMRAKTKYMMQFSEKIPGPKLLPILGNIFQFGSGTEAYLNDLERIVAEYGPISRVWLGPQLFIILTEPKYIEVVINSIKYIDKGLTYTFLVPWMGLGLLTSTGEKWKKHRKIITPTFHFKILEKYVDVFNKNGLILLERLSSHVNGAEFDVRNYIATYALDIISETAMGVTVNAQQDNSSEFVKAVKNISDIIMLRNFKPWIHPDFLFNLSSYGKLSRHCLSVLHNMTGYVISTRKKELMEEFKLRGSQTIEEDIYGAKRRLAFLDMLILSSLEGNKLTDKDIRDEVNTFIFEGHDTTASGISFSLWALAKHQDIQEKVVCELDSILGDSDRDAQFSDLQEMKYLEQVIKETMRLYPSVPIFLRKLDQDVEIDGYTIPIGTNVTFIPYILHRNPEHFPDPEKFDPDRFLQENCAGRHPYCYIPFSAGPRNCIGQRFAMLEMKATLCKVLRKFKLYLSNPEEKMDVKVELVLKPKKGIMLRIEPRKRKNAASAM
ncbi:cytochrome P450 4C1-like isoform X1 [Periplaneta americana]|uniref:cytochrome P450 4C1-like isoform X1 n=2 Tax=Periplaneta americana TaxID=6978 RepID=UPI0037E87E2F